MSLTYPTNNENFDIEAYFAFLESTAMSDPIGIDDFRTWISDLPKIL
jgi:hypothetical protein